MEFSLIWNFNSILALLRHYISTLNIFFIYLDDSSLVVDFWLFHGIHNFVSYQEEQLGNKYQHQSLTNIRIKNNFPAQVLHEMHCAIWYHLYNLKNVKNTKYQIASQMILPHTCMHWCKLTGITFFIQSLMFCDVKKWESPFLSTWILRKSSSKIGQIAFVGWVIYMGPSYPHISVKYGNAPQWSKSTKPIINFPKISCQFHNYNFLNYNKLDFKGHAQRIPKLISDHNWFSWFQSRCWTVV